MACCDEIVTKPEYQMFQFSMLMLDKIDNLVCDVENTEAFGESQATLENYDKLSEIWYIFYYFMLVSQEMDNRLKKIHASAGVTCVNDLDTIRPMYKEFSLDCMLDYIRCRFKMDGQKILDIFEIRRDIHKGIDWMVIENTDPCKPPFKIK